MSRPTVGIGVPMVVRFGPADVGRRVTLRRVLPDPTSDGPALGDVVGVLESWHDGVLELRRRNGELVAVEAAAVVAGRVVAPEVSAAELAVHADDTWRADDTEPLGQWRVRHHHGVTNRPNSVLAVGDPGMPIPDTAPLVQRWYAERGVVPSVMTPLPSPVADAYATLGWRQERETLVMAAALPDVVAAAAAHDPGPEGRVEVTGELPGDWTAVLPQLRADERTAAAHLALLRSSAAAGFATLRGTDGAPRAVARIGLARGWGNLTSVEVLERFRGQRLAVPVIGALAAWALERRATHAYLQTWPDNDAALRLYGRLGFTPHHRYAYFVPPDASGSARPDQPR